MLNTESFVLRVIDIGQLLLTYFCFAELNLEVHQRSLNLLRQIV